MVAPSSPPSDDVSTEEPSTRERLPISWSNVRYGVASAEILFGLDGEASTGEVLAILGPSGGGKTSLLNILGGRVNDCPEQGIKVSGDVLYAKKAYAKPLKRFLGYVMQEDKMYSELTVEETLWVSSGLTLPYSEKQRKDIIDHTISALGLEKCRNTKVSEISGGEKKRTAIATELICSPPALLLDEPTSGLDSSTAFELVTMLKKYAKENHATVIMTVHQPSSALFNSFDKVIFLGHGKVAWAGNPQELVEGIKESNFKCPEFTNPADYMLDLCRNDSSLETLVNTWSKQQNNPKDAADESTSSATTVPPKWTPMNSENTGYPTTWMQQFSTLLFRAFVQQKGSTFRSDRFFEIFMSGCVVGFMWWGFAHEESMWLEYISIVFFISIQGIFSPLFASISIFFAEKDIITRERRAGKYQLSAFYLAKSLAEAPISFAFPLLSATVVFWFTQVSTSLVTFFYVMVFQCLVIQTGVAMGIFLGAASPTIPVAMSLCSTLVTIQMTFTGFFGKAFNAFLEPLKWISAFRYGLHGTLKIFLSMMETNTDSEKMRNKILEQHPDMDPNADGVPVWVDIAGLAIMGITLRVLAYYALKYRTK